MNKILRDAWNTLVPGVDARQGPLPPLLIGLTIVTGVLDAFSYLLLGHVFVANMTGNVVFVAFAIAGASGFSLAASLVALGAFSLGALVGGRIGHRLSHHRGRLLAGAAALESALIFAAFAYAEIANHPFIGGNHYGLIVLLGMGMGVQNAGACMLAVPDLTTTVLTLTLTGISSDGHLAGGADSKIGRRLLSVASMLVGAVIGATIDLHAAPAINLLIAGTATALISLLAIKSSHSSPPWTEPA